MGCRGATRLADGATNALRFDHDLGHVNNVVEEYPQSRYIGYLSLVKFDGAWRIVNKVYTAERR